MLIEMPNSIMIPNTQESSIEGDVVITSTMMTTTTTNPNSTIVTMPEDMMFNAGHQLSIVVYRFVSTHTAVGALMIGFFFFFSHSLADTVF